MPYKILEDEKEVSEVLAENPITYFKSDGEHAVLGTDKGFYVTAIENLQRLKNSEYRERTIGSETGLGSISPIIGIEKEDKPYHNGFTY